MSERCKKFDELYKQHNKKRKEEHEKLCPPRTPGKDVIKLRKTRADIKERKIATCLGCGKQNNSCTCSDHLKPHIETQITYNWGQPRRRDNYL